MSQPVPRHEPPAAPETGLIEHAALDLDATAVMRPGGKGPHVKALRFPPIADQTAPQDDPHTGLYFRAAPPEVLKDAVLENDGLTALHSQLVRIP